MIRIASAVAAALLTASTAASALAASCISPSEARALQVRQLHIQLQVASLNCRTDDPSLPGKYATYIYRFGSQLNENAKILRGHLSRQGVNIDRYMTSLANDESQRAHQIDGYCESHVPLFDKLHALKASELEHFAAATMDKPDRPVCGPQVREASAKVTPKVAAKTEKKAESDKKAAAPKG